MRCCGPQGPHFENHFENDHLGCSVFNYHKDDVQNTKVFVKWEQFLSRVWGKVSPAGLTEEAAWDSKGRTGTGRSQEGKQNTSVDHRLAREASSRRGRERGGQACKGRSHHLLRAPHHLRAHLLPQALLKCLPPLWAALKHLPSPVSLTLCSGLLWHPVGTHLPLHAQPSVWGTSQFKGTPEPAEDRRR